MFLGYLFALFLAPKSFRFKFGHSLFHLVEIEVGKGLFKFLQLFFAIHVREHHQQVLLYRIKHRVTFYYCFHIVYRFYNSPAKLRKKRFCSKQMTGKVFYIQFGYNE